MAEPTKRLHYFDHQFLHEQDFSDEQAYHLGRRRIHNRLLHTWGIAEGLELSFVTGASDAIVGKGVATDAQGREIVLAEDTRTPNVSGHPSKQVYVTIAYAEQETDPLSETGVTGNTRITETPVIDISETAPGDPGQKLILGRLAVDGNGRITDKDEGDGLNRRRAAGVVGGDLEVSSLALTDPNVVPGGWPRLRLGAAGRVDLSGNLRVTGDIALTGTLTGGLAPNIVGPGQIAENAVTAAKIADGSVGAAKLANTSVTADKIADNAITAAKILDGSVGTLELANASVTADKIANNAVGTAKIADNAVTEGKLANGAVTLGKIPDGSIPTAKLANAAVTSDKIADGAVTEGKLANGAVTLGKIPDGSIPTAKLANAAVTSDKIADAAVNAAKIQDLSVGTAELANASVTGDKIANNAVINAKIADNAITAAKIADGNVGTAELANGAVTTDKIADETVTFSKLKKTLRLDSATSIAAGGTVDLTAFSAPLSSGSIISGPLGATLLVHAYTTTVSGEFEWTQRSQTRSISSSTLVDQIVQFHNLSKIPIDITYKIYMLGFS